MTYGICLCGSPDCTICQRMEGIPHWEWKSPFTHQDIQALRELIPAAQEIGLGDRAMGMERSLRVNDPKLLQACDDARSLIRATEDDLMSDDLAGKDGVGAAWIAVSHAYDVCDGHLVDVSELVSAWGDIHPLAALFDFAKAAEYAILLAIESLLRGVL